MVERTIAGDHADSPAVDSREEARVSTLELFFDLVFVFTITQLTSVLANHPDGVGVLRVVLMLVVIWWMYGGYVWLTNVVAPDRLAYQLLLLGGMAAFLVIRSRSRRRSGAEGSRSASHTSSSS